MTRPPRYTENNSNRDWIDEFIATSSAEEVRGAFRFTIGKYLRRYGKKDDPLQEALKIQDYANRLVAFERELAAPDHVELRRHPMTPNVIESASEMQSDSERISGGGFRVGDRVTTTFGYRDIPWGAICEVVGVPGKPHELLVISCGSASVWAKPEHLRHAERRP